MSQRIKVLLADDHPMFLDGVKNALKTFDDIEVVAACTNGNAVLELLDKLHIDVAVLDINIPEHSGIALAKKIKKEYAHIKVVFLTMYHPSAIGDEVVHSSLAQGYVLKNSGSQVLHTAITAVYNGVQYLDAKLKGLQPAPGQDVLTEGLKLSRREKEIIQLIGEGKGNKEIADALFLSELTIKTHRKNIYQKLSVNNVAALMMRIRGLELD